MKPKTKDLSQKNFHKLDSYLIGHKDEFRFHRNGKSKFNFRKFDEDSDTSTKDANLKISKKDIYRKTITSYNGFAVKRIVKALKNKGLSNSKIIEKIKETSKFEGAKKQILTYVESLLKKD